jgi:hypothetical protein
MMEYQDISSVMQVFAEKILCNLITADGATDEGKRIIQSTLEVFESLITSSSTCKLLNKLDLVQQLIQNHVMGFNILQNDSNFKHLGQFYKILASLWINEDFIENFDNYISQLNRIIQEIFTMDEN